MSEEDSEEAAIEAIVAEVKKLPVSDYRSADELLYGSDGQSRTASIEAMVDAMHPGVGENDTLGAPYCFDRGLLREFAARLIAAGYARRLDVEVDASLNTGRR